MIKVLIVEDHEMTRMGLAHALSLMADIELVAQADDGQKAVDLAKRYNPNIILMDIGLPKIDGIKATELIREAQVPSKILMFTSRDNKNDVIDALASGADGYVMKGASSVQLETAIRAVNEGTAWLDPAVAKIVLSSLKPNSSTNITSSTDNLYGLTSRELEVLQMIVNGSTNDEIADKMVISVNTVKSHVHSILQKLYCESRSKAVRLAIKEGLVR